MLVGKDSWEYMAFVVQSSKFSHVQNSGDKTEGEKILKRFLKCSYFGELVNDYIFEKFFFFNICIHLDIFTNKRTLKVTTFTLLFVGHNLQTII